MSMKFLGESFDLHTGGVDNIFPHHENEIAQSEAATGQPFVKYWMHAAHLIVDGAKMSKSKGNFYTLRDLMERGFDARSIRFLLLSTHYRSPLNFTFDGVSQAAAEIERLDDLRARLERECRAGDISAQALETGALMGLAGDGSVQGEAIAVKEALHDLEVGRVNGMKA